MDAIGQKQAVLNAVKNILGNSFASGETNVKEVLTSDQLNTLRDRIYEGAIDGSIAYNKDTSDTKAVRRYVNGMIDNHLRKSKELNGGNIYKPANTGAKRDATLKNLNRLLKNYEEGTDEYDQVSTAITNRHNELKTMRSTKKKDTVKSKVDTDIIPDELASIIE